jgi:hypothetical protein
MGYNINVSLNNEIFAYLNRRKDFIWWVGSFVPLQADQQNFLEMEVQQACKAVFLSWCGLSSEGRIATCIATASYSIQVPHTFYTGPFEKCIPDGNFRADVVLDTPRRFARDSIFATDQQLHLLRKDKRWYGDGTFFVCPTPFYQVFGIHAFIRHGNLDKQVS